MPVLDDLPENMPPMEIQELVNLLHQRLCRKSHNGNCKNRGKCRWYKVMGHSIPWELKYEVHDPRKYYLKIINKMLEKSYGDTAIIAEILSCLPR